MNLLVISDTHGQLDKAYEIYHKLDAVDLLIHLGDCQQDAQDLKQLLGVDVVSVKGNMDGAYGSKEFTVLPVECGNLYLAHGHMENVKMTYQNILYRAEEEGCMAALFGHTHKPLFEEAEGMYLINPGSLSLPADGGQGSCALVTTSPQGLKGTIYQFGSVEKPAFPTAEIPKAAPKPAKVQGGYLRGLLNYSDRF